MNAVAMIVLWAAVAVVTAVLAGILAGWKNRDYSFWVSLTFLLPPLVLVILLLPRRAGPRPRPPTLDELDASEGR